MECPSCGRDDFASERGMKAHHKRAHGESLAGVECVCPVCGTSFRRKQAYIDKAKRPPTCSKECKDEREREGKYKPCDECGEEIYVMPFHLNRTPKHFCNMICRSRFFTQENNPNWGGGSDGFFDAPSGRAWRRAVFERDNYTCQDCGDSSGGNLNAHHIKRRAECNKFTKYAVWNGVTLCAECHAERHKGGAVYEMLLSKI